MKRFLPCISFFILFCAACSIDNRAKDMQKTSDRIEGISKNLSQATCKVVRVGAKAGSYDHVNKAIEMEALFNPNVQGAEKLNYASVVYRALPFQNWDGLCGDDQERLQWYYKDSVHLVFSRIHDHIDDSLPVDTSTLDPLSDNAWNSLGALGAMMEILDYDYEKNMAAANLPALSFYDLVVTGLKSEAAFNRGESVPDYVVEVLRWKPEMIYLLQLRHNYLLGMVLVLATDLEDGILKSGSWYLNPHQVSLTDPQNSSLARISQYLKWLKLAQQTREDLKSLGIPVLFNAKYARVAANVQWVPAPTTAQLSPSLLQMQNEFIKTYSELVAESSVALKPEGFRARYLMGL